MWGFKEVPGIIQNAESVWGGFKVLFIESVAFLTGTRGSRDLGGFVEDPGVLEWFPFYP